MITRAPVVQKYHVGYLQQAAYSLQYGCLPHVNPIAKGDGDGLLTSVLKVERRSLPDAAVGASDNGHLPVQPCLAVTPSA